MIPKGHLSGTNGGIPGASEPGSMDKLYVYCYTPNSQPMIISFRQSYLVVDSYDVHFCKTTSHFYVLEKWKGCN